MAAVGLLEHVDEMPVAEFAVEGPPLGAHSREVLRHEENPRPGVQQAVGQLPGKGTTLRVTKMIKMFEF